MHFGTGRHDRRRPQVVPHRALLVALMLEQRGEAHVRVEVYRFAIYHLAIDGQRFQRIFFSETPRLLEAFASARCAKTFFDLALGSPFKIENQLPGFRFEAHRALANDDASVEIFELEGARGAGAANEISHSREAALNRFEMTTGGKQLLGQPHQDQIVESETKVAPAPPRRIDELAAHPVTDALRRHRENSRRRPRRESLI